MTDSDRIETVEEVLQYLMLPQDAVEVLFPAARRLQRAAIAMGSSVHADLLKMDICHRIRLGQELIFQESKDPVREYSGMLDHAAAKLEHDSYLPVLDAKTNQDKETSSILDVTADHYGHLWGGFSREHYFDEALNLLRTRMERNEIDPAWFRGKRALDCGCGGGRYTVALRRLGFEEVVGVDWSEEALGTATRFAEEAGIQGVIYKRADVLRLPFEDDAFDFVFSNGVLHHTEDTQRGVGELVRVMKTGGRGWIYLYARPGGLDRLTHYLARLIMKHASREVCRRYCDVLFLGGSRSFFLLDLWLTPVAECYTPAETEELLRRAGCSRYRRLARGTDTDLIEQIYRNVSYASCKFGVGENRYYLEGKNRR